MGMRYACPVADKRRNAGFGGYPEIGIARASKLVMAMREQIAAGSVAIKKEISSKLAVHTFKAVAEASHVELLPGWKNYNHSQ